MQLTVAIITSAHGLKGEVRLDVRTDSPEERLADGVQLETDPAEFGPLQVKRTRTYKGMWYALFEEVTDRTQAESMRGVRLVIETDEEESREEGAFYSHELAGLPAVDPDGNELGTVTGLEPNPAHELLLVKTAAGTVRVPFVHQIVTDVDLDEGRVVIDPPGGLFEDE
ncbi:MAG: ribosome maturation factor RimM [Flaviflexus sp.]|nr:ribosome maturation factor RimM [Flaviflexus sp.]